MTAVPKPYHLPITFPGTCMLYNMLDSYANGLFPFSPQVVKWPEFYPFLATKKQTIESH